MKLLIMTMNVGRTAPGIVFERLIDGLSKTYHVDVITADLDPSIELRFVKKASVVKRRNIHPRIEKLLISLLGLNPFDWFWARRVSHHLRKSNQNYDLVFSFISFHHYAALLGGYHYSKITSTKWAVYSVDAIPAPLGWSKNDGYFRGVKRMIGKFLSNADFLFSANEMMLNYQLSVFKPRKNIVTEVIYNPSDSTTSTTYGATTENKNIFLYTGGIYQIRKADYVLAAFEQLLETYPDSCLFFVGTTLPSSVLSHISEKTRKQIHLLPFTRQLSEYYKKATALLDIDADIENDVFLSSKIVNYIKIDRPIICETGHNSPSRKIFGNTPSILQCGHNKEEIYDAMRTAIEKKCKFDYSDRVGHLRLFDIERIVKKIDAAINVY